MRMLRSNPSRHPPALLSSSLENHPWPGPGARAGSQLLFPWAAFLCAAQGWAKSSRLVGVWVGASWTGTSAVPRGRLWGCGGGGSCARRLPSGQGARPCPQRNIWGPARPARQQCPHLCQGTLLLLPSSSSSPPHPPLLPPSVSLFLPLSVLSSFSSSPPPTPFFPLLLLFFLSISSPSPQGRGLTTNLLHPLGPSAQVLTGMNPIPRATAASQGPFCSHYDG